MGQPANLMRIVNPFQQSRNRPLQNRMAQVWGQFGEWNQDEEGSFHIYSMQEL